MSNLHRIRRVARHRTTRCVVFAATRSDIKPRSQRNATQRKTTHGAARQRIRHERSASRNEGDDVAVVAADADDGSLWFPHHISELDKSSNRVLMYGAELDADHPVILLTILPPWMNLTSIGDICRGAAGQPRPLDPCHKIFDDYIIFGSLFLCVIILPYYLLVPFINVSHIISLIKYADMLDDRFNK